MIKSTSSRRSVTVAAAVISIGGLLLAGCAGNPGGDSPENKELTPVSFRLGFTGGGWDVGEYVALERGYFEEEGLDVTISEGKGSADNLQLLEAGQLDIAKVSLSSVVMADSNGGTSKLVSSHVQIDGSGIIADPSFTSVSDLDGASYAGLAFDFSTQMLPAFERAAGIKLNAQMVDPAGIPSLFLAGKVQSTLAYGWAEKIALEVKGEEFSYFPYADQGITTVGVGYAVSGKFLEEKPEIVQAFVKAALRGWQDVYDDPEETAKILNAQFPLVDIETAVATAKAMESFAHTEASKKLPLGEVTQDDIVSTIDIMVQTGLIDEAKAPKPEDVYSNLVFD